MLLTPKTLALVTLGLVAVTVEAIPPPGGFSAYGGGRLAAVIQDAAPKINIGHGKLVGTTATVSVPGKATQHLHIPPDYKPPTHLDTPEKLAAETEFLTHNRFAIDRQEAERRVQQAKEATTYHLWEWHARQPGAAKP